MIRPQPHGFPATLDMAEGAQCPKDAAVNSSPADNELAPPRHSRFLSNTEADYPYRWPGVVPSKSPDDDEIPPLGRCRTWAAGRTGLPGGGKARSEVTDALEVGGLLKGK